MILQWIAARRHNPYLIYVLKLRYMNGKVDVPVMDGIEGTGKYYGIFQENQLSEALCLRFFRCYESENEIAYLGNGIR